MQNNQKHELVALEAARCFYFVNCCRDYALDNLDYWCGRYRTIINLFQIMEASYVIAMDDDNVVVKLNRHEYCFDIDEL